MTRLQWIFAGASAGAAGALAIVLAAAPTVSTPTPAIAPAPAPAPTVAVVSTPAAPAAPSLAPAPIRAQAKRVPSASGIVPGSAGMVIGIDPESGEAGMPTPEQLSELKLDESSNVSRDAGGILVHHPNGMVSLDLQGTNQDYAVIRKAKDGTNVIGCIQHPNDLEHVHLTPTKLEEE